MSSMPSLSPVYKDFLYATVYEERNEMQLSVISALARLGLDPWTEAANLAGMSGDGAALRLSGLLLGVVDSHATEIDRAAIATRLVTLLPQTSERIASKHGWSARGVQRHGLARPNILGMLCLALLLAAGVSFAMTSLAPGQGGGRQDGKGAPSVSGGAAAPSNLSGSSTPRPPR
jgi:hypothetical protein